MQSRKINQQRCLDIQSDKKRTLILDLKIARFIVKKREMGKNQRYQLGALWNILDPLLLTLIYYFVFTVVKYNTNAGLLVIGISLCRGLQQNLIYGATSNLDFTAGLKIERVRNRAIILSEFYHVVSHSFYSSIGTLMVLLILDSSLWAIPLIPIVCILNGLMWYGYGRILSNFVRKFPDLKNIIRYFGMMMFFTSPVLYPLSITTGLHRKLNLYNPFSFISEPTRAILFGDSSYELLNFNVGLIILITSFISLILGLLLLDRQRWSDSTWS